MYYIALVTKEKNKYVVTFPACPGCNTFIEDSEDIQDVAAEALEGWLETRIQTSRDIPFGEFNFYVENSAFELPSIDRCSILMPVTIETNLVSKIIAYKNMRGEQC